jgi:hypothetical protein
MEVGGGEVSSKQTGFLPEKILTVKILLNIGLKGRIACSSKLPLTPRRSSTLIL